MKTETSSSPVFSPLAVDLVLSKVGIAALKAKARVPLDVADITSAIDLKSYFSSRLDAIKSSSSVPVNLVPEAGMRQVLEEALSSVRSSAALAEPSDLGLIDRLLSLLSELATSRDLHLDAANELLDLLQKLESLRGAEATVRARKILP